jgi:release factor glutamine methyltransferase
MVRARLLAEAAARLGQAGVEGPARDARLLLREASGLSAAELAARLGEAAGEAEAERFAAFVAERAQRRPLAQIVGRRLFWGREFMVTGAVLDPRPETETLIAAALRLGPRRRVLDLGTGSGCLLVTLLLEWPGATGLGIDASAAALAVAGQNAARLGAAARADFAPGDWLHGVGPGWDLIVANPPYIADGDIARLEPEPRDWEPRLALAAGPDGLAAFRCIAAALPRVLASGAVAIFEHGAEQGPEVRDLFAAAGFRTLEPLADLSGRRRGLVVHG